MSSAPRPSRFDRSLIEGPLEQATWKLAWPTMLQNMFGGLQGIIDHAMVGHYVGYVGNAAVGISWQIVLVVIVFISSVYTGMAVLVARHAGANRVDDVNHVVYQAMMLSVVGGVGVLAPLGYVSAPWLLTLVNAAPAVNAEALPFLRIMFVGIIGMLTFFLMSGALRAAGDARTPLRMGIAITLLTVALNVILIRGLGPIPAMGTRGAAIGSVIASTLVGAVSIWLLVSGRLVVQLPASARRGPDWATIRQLFRFGLPAGVQGVAMNIAGVFLLRFIGSLPQSAEAQAAYAIGYTELFSFITWSSVGLMGATATLAGQNLGAGRADRAMQAPRIASRLGLTIAGIIGFLFLVIPRQLLGIFGMTDDVVVELGVELLRYLAVSGFFITVALTYTGALQGTGDTRSPLVISLVSQIGVPLGLCTIFEMTVGLEPWRIWLAIVLGHLTRCGLSIVRFRQGRWQEIRIEPARPTLDASR